MGDGAAYLRIAESRRPTLYFRKRTFACAASIALVGYLLWRLTDAYRNLSHPFIVLDETAFDGGTQAAVELDDAVDRYAARPEVGPELSLK